MSLQTRLIHLINDSERPNKTGSIRHFANHVQWI